mmetsp:Transcript_35956/g.36402  ORF Transcript_35956/g.36402 Transcript_35956/m.36402 type:complete len:97 (-) Transcript_35956:185-475(-)
MMMIMMMYLSNFFLFDRSVRRSVCKRAQTTFALFPLLRLLWHVTSSSSFLTSDTSQVTWFTNSYSISMHHHHQETFLLLNWNSELFHSIFERSVGE